MDEILKRIILENQDIIARRELIKRNYHIPKTDNISILTGIRRCGKTFTLYEIAKSFPIEEILFIDFEDERLLTLNSVDNYDIILDSYKTIYPNLHPVIFFDEIQNLKNWHLFLKRLHVAGYKIFVTGSNANLISREIATFLKGRSLETTIYPFSFSEFLKLKKESFSEKDQIVNQPKILNHFDEYLSFGGFPEVIKANIDEKRVVAKNIYSLLFYKDLVAKYEKDEYLLKLVVNKIVENITKDFSISSLAKKIMSIHKTSIPTVTDYFNILPDPYLTFNIYPFRKSFLQREAKRKTYVADNSFILLNRITNDKSRLFENLVFSFLNRLFPEVYYYKTSNNKEVDFFVKNTDSQHLIQASYLVDNEDTLNREKEALVKAMKEQNMKTSYIFTYNNLETIKSGENEIKVVMFWKIALNGRL